MQEVNDESKRRLITIELRRLPWSSGLSDATIAELSESAEYLELQEGDVVHQADQTLDAVVFIVSGRLRATALDLFGKPVLDRFLVRGGAFGLFSIANPEQANTNVVAVEPSHIIRLKTERLLELIAAHSDLQMNLYRLAGDLIRKLVKLDRKLHQPSAVGVIHQSKSTRPLTSRLVERLTSVEQHVRVASDDPDWEPIEGVAFRLLFENGRLIPEDQRHEQLRQWKEVGRIFVDMSAEHDFQDLSRFMTFADMTLWCVRPRDAAEAIKALRTMEDQVPGWRDKIRLIWVLDGVEEDCAPRMPELRELVHTDFKVALSEIESPPGTMLQRGIERIVHHLRGVRIGLALGGGAARGMAHLGVLKALEDNGIYIDMLAGTSAGAMAGTAYASGISADDAVAYFKTDLRLPWHFRIMPAGKYWYLFYKYRSGRFDPMLRKYLGNKCLEQLPLPIATVTVDLVSGDPVIRETGDATRSILESINLPVLSSPLTGNGQALVDGGLVNNIPADILVKKGCNFVMASSVTAELEREFGGIRADQPTSKSGSPSSLKVLLRGYTVQSYNMTDVGVQPADYVLAPDVTSFDLAEFERADEMAAVGETTTLASIDNIKRLLHKLDPQLFP